MRVGLGVMGHVSAVTGAGPQGPPTPNPSWAPGMHCVTLRHDPACCKDGGGQEEHGRSPCSHACHGHRGGDRGPEAQAKHVGALINQLGW